MIMPDPNSLIIPLTQSDLRIVSKYLLIHPLLSQPLQFKVTRRIKIIEILLALNKILKTNSDSLEGQLPSHQRERVSICKED